MNPFSIDEYLSLPIPIFSEPSTAQNDATAMGGFLSALMPVLSVTVIWFEGDRCLGGDWISPAEMADTTPLSPRLEQERPEGILPLLREEGLAQGEALDRYLGLNPEVHAVGCVLSYATGPCGCLLVCRKGAWQRDELRLLARSHSKLNALYAQRLSTDRTNRTSFVFNTIMDSMKTSVYVTNPETHRILFMNQSMKEDFQIPDPEGKFCYEVLQRGIEGRCAFCPVDQLQSAGEGAPPIQWEEVNSKTGRCYHNYDSLIRWMDGSLVHLQQSIDVTDLKTANTDELTQLLSRRPGKEALEQTLKLAQEGEQTVTVGFYDINNLKLVNDRFGHAEGDRLITSVVDTVQGLLRDGEYAFRMSGDEFVVVFFAGEGDARRRLTSAQTILSALDPRYDAGFCFGLVEVAPTYDAGVENVILLADERMYEQKRKYHIARNATRLRAAPQNRSGDSFQYDKERLYAALAGSTDDYPFICNMKTGLFRYAPAMVEEFGLPGEVIENAAAVWGGRVHEADKAAFLEENQAILDGRATSHCVEYRALNRRGEWVWVRCRGQVEMDESGSPTLFAGFISNLDGQNKIDHLTGLFNKLEFEECIHRHIDYTLNAPLGILILGLDDLKHINDLYDRSFGDEVIRITAQRLQALLPAGAALYRLDGDEFGILVRGASETSLQGLCHTIIYSFEVQQEHKGRKFYCTLSGGSVLYPRDGDNFLDLAKYASYCLTYAKRHGKKCCVAYSPGILDHRERSLEMVEELRSSVRNGFEGFSLRYQPLVEPSAGRLLGAEALLRWECSRFGSVSPVEFIPLLEQTGMIIPVGKWVLANAIRRCTPWLQHQTDFILNVNLSYLQIQGTELVPLVVRVLEENQFPSQNLVLELTESYFVRDNHHVQGIFGQLRDRGVRIAVDDFGTGFSSLSILKNIPADEVKIDRSFIRDIRTSTFDATFIRLVVELCHNVDLSVCLEGVETAEEYDVVKDMGLDILQGFHFSHPITGEEFETRYFQA